MRRPTAKTAFFPCTALGCCRTDQGGCLEKAGTLSLCLHFSFQARHFGRRDLPSSSRLCFPGGSMPSHSGLSSEDGCWEGLVAVQACLDLECCFRLAPLKLFLVLETLCPV